MTEKKMHLICQHYKNIYSFFVGYEITMRTAIAADLVFIIIIFYKKIYNMKDTFAGDFWQSTINYNSV